MTVPLYEFTATEPTRPRRKWLIALVAACPVVVAAVWGISVLERKRSETLVRESFELRTGFHNEVVGAIAQVPQLQEESIRSLAKYPRLQVVDLSGTTAVSGGLRSLLQINDLRVLSLRGCAWVDDEQAARLGELTCLKRLDLSGTRITDAALREVSELPRLSQLKFEHCKGITDAGLEVCAGMNQLSELWPGGAGYSLAGLLALRERRRDLSLQVKPSDVLRPSVHYLSSDAPLDAGWNISPIHQPSLYAVVSTEEDIQALFDLLRFKQNWGFGHNSQISQGGYEERIEETWTSLELHGPAAVRSLATAFPLTPKLVALSLHDTAIATADFPFDLVPQGLRQLSVKNSSVSESLLQLLPQHAALERLSLSGVTVEGVAVRGATNSTHEDVSADAALPELQIVHIENTAIGESLLQVLSRHDALKELWLIDVAVDGSDLLRNTSVTAENFPPYLLPPRLCWLHIERATISESFLRSLSQVAALQQLSLTKVAIDRVDLTDPASGRFPNVRSLRLQDVTVDGMNLTDPALESFTLRLRKQLPRTQIDIYTVSNDGKYLQWHEFGE